MKTNKVSPLEELRIEREIVRQQCAESEDRLAEQWDYLSDNAGSLLLNAAVSNITGLFGFGHKSHKSSDTKQIAQAASSGNGIMSMLSSYYPLIWDIAQPLIWKFAMNKIKSIFTKKNKKGKDD